MAREVMLEKSNDGRENLKITIKSRAWEVRKTPMDKQNAAKNAAQQKGLDNLTSEIRGVSSSVDEQKKSARSVSQISQAGFGHEVQRTLKPKWPEIGSWKTNKAKACSREVQSQLTFDWLMSKYTKQRTDSVHRPIKKESGCI